MIALGLILGLGRAQAPSALYEGFDEADGLLTNEVAYWDAGTPGVRRSDVFDVTSGSLFAREGGGWTGRPDLQEPDVASSTATNSGVFRLVTRRVFAGDVTVSVGLKNLGLVRGTTETSDAWDGVHILIRYQSQYSSYYASVNRRDGTVGFKKKCVGGPSNGGTYYQLGDAVRGHPPDWGDWENVRVAASTNTDGSVQLSMYRGGRRVAEAVDRGVGCGAITHAGRVGIRGDNDEFVFDDLIVEAG